MLRSRMLWVAVAGALIWAGAGYASPPTNVTVELSGPTDAWVETDLRYDAQGSYELDGDTQEEVNEGQAFVTERYLWSYTPADLVAGGGEGDAFAEINYDYEHGGAVHTVSVIYEVTVTYADQTSEDPVQASDSLEVAVKRVTVSVAIGGDVEAICAGAKQTPPHQATVIATVTDGFGEPLSGKAVAFSTDHEWNQTPPDLDPTNPTTNDQGVATTTLTSGDGAVSGEVEASCEGHAAEATIAFEEPVKELSFEDPDTGDPIMWLYADGESECRVVLEVTYGPTPVSQHGITWRFRFWDAEDDPAEDPPAYEGTGDGELPYGSLAPTATQTEADGKTHTVYTVGTVGGSIEFVATDTDVYRKGSWVPSTKTKGLGNPGGSIPVVIVGVHWMKSANYQTVESWQSHIRLNGEALYPMVELKPKVEHGTVPQTTEIRVWSGATDQTGFRMDLPKQAGPDANGVYKYWPGPGDEPKIGPATNGAQHIIGVSHGPNDTDERTTHDNGPDPSDSNALTWGHLRGNGRYYEDEQEVTLWADLEYLRCAGIEKVYVESTKDTSKKDAIAAKSQADLLYFSGHGQHAGGTLFGRYPYPDPNDKLPHPGVNASDIGPATHWSVDLDAFVIAACAVLNIADLTGHDNNCGRDWADACIAGRSGGGPLDALCGYHDSAPGDHSGHPQTIAQEFSSRFNGSNAPAAWREANNALPVGTWWCAMDASTYYWHYKNILGLWRNGQASY